MRADREPPYATEAEVAVLGGMLIDGDAAAKALEVLDDTMFYRESHRRICKAMMALFQAGNVIDPQTLGSWLEDRDELERTGGMPYISELLDAVPTAANIEYHAEIVRNRWQRRKVIEACTEGIRMAHGTDHETPAIVDRVEQLLVAGTESRGGAVSLRQALYPTFERIEEIQASEGGITGIPTGLTDLDEMTGGLQKGDLVVVAARPSMGKTALVTGICTHAVLNGTPTALFSLEMSKQQVVQRILCAEALVDLGRMLRGRLWDDDFTRLERVSRPLNSAPLWIDDSGAVTAGQIRAASKKLQREQGIKLIAIDYLGLMAGDREAENRTNEIGQITRSLKRTALDLDVPIVLLAQLNRGPQNRSDHRPQLSDLRDSGRIEEDADLVLFVHRPEYFMAPDEIQQSQASGKAELIVAKHRNGPTGTVDLFFRKECARFEGVESKWGVPTRAA